jgi:hypothetical protein
VKINDLDNKELDICPKTGGVGQNWKGTSVGPRRNRRETSSWQGIKKIKRKKVPDNEDGSCPKKRGRGNCVWDAAGKTLWG